MELIFSRRFKKQAQKLVENKPNLKKRLDSCLIDFSQKGLNSVFYRKPLIGNWKGFHELQVGGDIRIIVKIRIIKNQAVLEQVGTHAQLGF